MRTHFYYILAIVLLCLILFITCKKNNALRQENKRLSHNQEVLNSNLKEYILKDSTQKVEIEELTYSKDEFLRYCQEYSDEIERLGIKVKRLQELNQTITQGTYLIDTLILKDTIVMSDERRLDTLKQIDYSTPYISLTANVLQDTIKNLQVVTFDTITTIVSKEYRKRFLFFKWQPYYKTTLHNKNPYSRITNSETIKIK